MRSPWTEAPSRPGCGSRHWRWATGHGHRHRGRHAVLRHGRPARPGAAPAGPGHRRRRRAPRRRPRPGIRSLPLAPARPDAGPIGWVVARPGPSVRPTQAERGASSISRSRPTPGSCSATGRSRPRTSARPSGARTVGRGSSRCRPPTSGSTCGSRRTARRARPESGSWRQTGGTCHRWAIATNQPWHLRGLGGRPHPRRRHLRLRAGSLRDLLPARRRRGRGRQGLRSPACAHDSHGRAGDP